MEWMFLSWPTLILLGIGLRISLRLTYGVRGPEPGDPVHAFLNITAWVLIVLGLLPALVGGIITMFGIIILFLGTATAMEVVIQSRHAQRRSICRMLALTIDRGTQLESSVLFAGQSMRGTVGRSARKLFLAMKQGMPLQAALYRFPSALPREAPAYFAAGTRRESRLAALRELSRADESLLTSTWRDCIDRVIYLAAVLFFMAAILTFVMLQIVPEFRQIFDEFQVSLPAMTEIAVLLSDLVVRYLAVPIFWLFTLLAIAISTVGICYLCDVPILRPIADQLFRRSQSGNVLRILAIATENREPLLDVMNRLSSIYPAAPLRHQIQQAAAHMARGADWREALHFARIIDAVEKGLLQTAELTGNLSWALRELARRREKRIIYRLAAALQTLYPLTIVLIGAFVGFVCVSLFIPIVELIEGLAR